MNKEKNIITVQQEGSGRTLCCHHWSEVRLDNASIVYKSEAGSNRPPPDSGAPLLYRFVLQTVALVRVFLPWLRFRPGQFYNHKDRSIQEEFWAKNLEYYGFITPRNGIYNWRSGVPQTLFINTSSFCYFHTKSTRNIQELLLLDEYSQEIWRNEAATLWTKAYRG
jgi:hypothetical protein